MIRVSILWAGLAGLTGCALSHDVGGEPTASGALPAALAQDKECLQELEDSLSGLPNDLECTGLYTDMRSREVSADVMPYEPALKLWSDGLNKSRYIYVPKGTQIDASDANGWKFPIGTRFWKEFQEPGTDIPVETRIYYKKDEGEWKQSTYEWNAAKTSAKRVTTAKDVVMSNGQTHWLPGSNDCEECHKGRRDRVLGFEQIAMGLPEASGETLAQLIDDGLVKGLKSAPDYHIGPDDKSVDAKALGWIHMNCGVTCHNDNVNRTGQSVDMSLRLNAEELDGRPTDSFPAVTTTVGTETETLRWLGHTRIVPGSPADSWLYTLITQRGDSKQQMPPISTYLVDPDGSDWVKQWIENLKAP
jgi:hypothetical protein